MTDVQFSGVAILDDAAGLAERVRYDAYGRAQHHEWRDVDGDGDYDSTDYNTITTLASAIGGTNIEDGSYEADADLDRDGDVDSTDQTLATTNYVSALAVGELSNSTVQNTIGWDGYVFNAETEEYIVRFRWYNAELARWLERDPVEYVDGTTLYEYVVSAPVDLLDPSGLVTADPPGKRRGVNDVPPERWRRRKNPNFKNWGDGPPLPVSPKPLPQPPPQGHPTINPHPRGVGGRVFSLWELVDQFGMWWDLWNEGSEIKYRLKMLEARRGLCLLSGGTPIDITAPGGLVPDVYCACNPCEEANLYRSQVQRYRSDWEAYYDRGFFFFPNIIDKHKRIKRNAQKYQDWLASLEAAEEACEAWHERFPLGESPNVRRASDFMWNYDERSGYCDRDGECVTDTPFSYSSRRTSSSD